MSRVVPRGQMLSTGILAVMVSVPCVANAEAANGLASEILRATGVRGGLVVHVGCGDGRLTAALGSGDGYLVHGLDADATNVREAQRHACDAVEAVELALHLDQQARRGRVEAPGRDLRVR